jgi:hypothetical protein
MVDQTHAAGYLSQRLGHQLAQARTAAERDEILKNTANSEQAARILNRVDDDRLHDKIESIEKNQEILDQVHISDKAKALYHLEQNGIKEAPEKIHQRLRDDATEIPTPEPSQDE